MLRKKIFICADYFIPGFKAGGPIQSLLNIIEILAKNFDVFVLTRNHDWGDDEAYNYTTNQWHKMKNCSICYVTDVEIKYSYLASKIKEINPHFVYLNSLYSPISQAAIRFLLLNKLNIKYVLAPRGELSSEAINIKKYVKIPYIKFLKFLGISKKITWHVTSTKEQQDVKNYFGNKSHTILMSNIPKQSQENWVPRQKIKGEVKIVLVGRIDKMKNIDFLLNLMTTIKEGNVQIDIIGNAKEESYKQHCSSLASQLPENIKVNFIGALSPTLIKKQITNYHFFVSPTLGENFGHAIFEALIAGVPVLISDRTPWIDLFEKKAGWVFSLENSSLWNNQLQDCIKMDEMEYNLYSKSAWVYAKKYNQEANYRIQLNKIFS